MPLLRLLLALALLMAGGAARAQVLAEQVTNHAPTTSYSVDYTPATGPDRVVIAIVFSEYELTQASTVQSVRLGGVPMRALGTIDDAGLKRNRMSAFLLPAASVPAGTSTLTVGYGPDPSASLVYLATVRNIDQASLASTPVAFSRGCSTGAVNPAGSIDFAPVAASANSTVFSFVGTGNNAATTTFRNGGAKFFDERVFSPGFSLAGAVQSSPVDAVIAGRADLSNGCHRRPSTVQIDLRPAGSGIDGTVAAPDTIVVEAGLPLRVEDADLNVSSSVVDTITVTVVNRRTGERETVTLRETGPATGVFTGTLPTQTAAGAAANNSGRMVALAGDWLDTSYFDSLTTAGGTATRTASTLVVRGPGAAVVVVAKSSTQVATAGAERFAVPGADVLYAITVTNTGEGPVDAGTVLVLDGLPAEVVFVNGPAVGGAGDPVAFSDAGSGVEFVYTRDVRFAAGTARPADFAACAATPAAEADPAIRWLCVRPGGRLLPGSPAPSFTVRFRARVR